MEPSLSESMREAVVRALVLLGRASQAAGGAGASDDAVMVTQQVHTVHGRLGLVDPELVAVAGSIEDDAVVKHSLDECRLWLVKAAGVLDEAVRSETSSLLPAGLLTVRADLAHTIRLVTASKGSAP